jgi:hypothetical protein
MINITEKRNYKTILNVVCLTLLMLDSGGGLGIRNISFLIITFFALYGLFKFKSFNKNFIYVLFIFLVSLIRYINISF